MHHAAIIALGLLAVGCTAPVSMPDTPAQRAKAVIAASLVGTAPQNLMPAIATCAASNATVSELDRLQGAIATAPNAATRRIARAIIHRAQTQRCLNDHGIVMANR
ncbi:hypothetical protein [Pseudorhodobacter sp.]|uniref:hypothetical protein n=1 Tax=Pseudorhodobacter sp. TaxID=1934400 RepID=UPI0039E333C4